jgi:hypothetical protein
MNKKIDCKDTFIPDYINENEGLLKDLFLK